MTSAHGAYPRRVRNDLTSVRWRSTSQRPVGEELFGAPSPSVLTTSPSERAPRGECHSRTSRRAAGRAGYTQPIDISHGRGSCAPRRPLIDRTRVRRGGIGAPIIAGQGVSAPGDARGRTSETMSSDDPPTPLRPLFLRYPIAEGWYAPSASVRLMSPASSESRVRLLAELAKWNSVRDESEQSPAPRASSIARLPPA
jgi:hypothetical protein